MSLRLPYMHAYKTTGLNFYSVSHNSCRMYIEAVYIHNYNYMYEYNVIICR